MRASGKKSPIGPSLSENKPAVTPAKGAKIKTIRQILLRDPDIDSLVASPNTRPNPVLDAVKKLSPETKPKPEPSSVSYESAISIIVSQCVDPAKDSFVTARVSDFATAATSSVKNAGDEDPAGSTSSKVSDESGTSNLSVGGMNKPHKGNDSKWEAIRTVRTRDGALGLNHFRLLKKLGCGDIGSVYLAELSGTQSYFAMKVMEKAGLAARKKLPRAQTEREILQCLDHPFLPTLYTHFETERFSCLVMEFCPGGDLHALRQKQTGKYFSEQAARWTLNKVADCSCVPSTHAYFNVMVE